MNAGFPLGSTVQSKTKGIWMWCVPHPRKTDHTLVLLDTEGLGDIEKVRHHVQIVLHLLHLLLRPLGRSLVSKPPPAVRPSVGRSHVTPLPCSYLRISMTSHHMCTQTFVYVAVATVCCCWSVSVR